MVSVVVPIHNEERSLLPLYDRLTVTLESLRRPYEILFIDDASTDRSFELLSNLVETDAHLKVIRLRRNFGTFPRCWPKSTRVTISPAVGVRTAWTMPSRASSHPVLRTG
jgi:cellulose synthase/poly-beta-1,6-N-acetylglucosamine synthase-like glycosyltransferase